MKKIILLLLLVLVGITASARKSYIEVRPSGNTGYYMITGDVPTGITYFEYKNVGTSRESAEFGGRMGILLNKLSELGYEVEFAPAANYYLLSKEISSSQTIIKGDVNEDSEVNIADVNEVISLILGYVREHPEILEQIRK